MREVPPFLRLMRSALCLLDDGGLQVHLACAGDLRLNVVAVDGGFEQADAAHLGACLDVCAALDLQALDDGDGVAVDELVTDGVENLGACFFFGFACCGAFPFVAAHGACPEFAHFVGVVFVAFGAGGCFDFVEVFAHGSFFELCGCAAPLHLVTAALGGGAAACGRASARAGCDGGGCEDSRVRADYTIWRVRTACAGLVFAGLLGRVRGVDEAENKICIVHA